MHERLRIFLATCFYYSGLIKLAHWLVRRSRPHLIVLYYHRATGGDLRRQMLYLRRHYRILPLEQALEELYTPREKRKPGSDRRMPLAITFDDGYRDNYTYGFALARQLQVPITLFLIPGYIESGDYFWWLEGKRLVDRAQVDRVTLQGRTYHLEQPEERESLAQAIDRRARYARSVAEREAFLSMIRELLAIPATFTAEDDLVRPLTWTEAREMEASGWVSFGAHTMHHPILACLADPAEVEYEVRECRAVLEKQLGHPVRTFAYPLGQPEHIGDEALRAVKAAGYEWALTTIEERNASQSDPFLLRRLPANVHWHWLVMASELVGLLGVVSSLKKRLARSSGRPLSNEPKEQESYA